MPTFTQDNETIKKMLEKNGYVIVHGVLSSDEISTAKKMMEEWEEGVPSLSFINSHSSTGSLTNTIFLYVFNFFKLRIRVDFPEPILPSML